MKVGIAGAGAIVPDFLKAAEKVADLKVEAICATRRSADRLKIMAGQYGIPKVYGDYDNMLEDEELDVIYVAVPNSLHYTFSKKALKKGKSVICEKPFCSCYEEGLELADLARREGLWMFEAISNQYFPNYAKVKEGLERLGPIRLVDMNFSQYSRRYDDFKNGEIHPVFDPEKSGGVLMDLNVYNIHFVTGLFCAPDQVDYHANIQKGIDTSGVLILTYPGFICTLAAAKDSSSEARINIQGEKGYMISDCKANAFEHFSWKEKGAGEPVHFALNREKERLYDELKAFTDMILSGDRKSHEQQLDHSLMVQKILDEARRQAGIKIAGRQAD